MNSSAENLPFRSEESFACSKFRHETDMTTLTRILAFAFEVCSKSSTVARKWISHLKFASSRFCRRTIIHSMFEFLIKRNYFKLSSSFQSFNPVIFCSPSSSSSSLVVEVVRNLQNIFFDLFMVERVIWRNKKGGRKKLFAWVHDTF